MAVVGWNPAEYTMHQQSRRDDMMRNLLNMFLQKKQFDVQDRRYQDQLSQQQKENEFAEKRIETSGRFADIQEKQLAWEQNKPRVPTAAEIKRQDIANNPYLSNKERWLLTTTGSIYTPEEKIRMEEGVRSGTRRQEDADKFNRGIEVAKSLGLPENEWPLFASGKDTPSLITAKEEAKLGALDRAISSIEDSYAKGDITKGERDRRIAIKQGLGTNYYESESDKANAKRGAVTESNKLYGMAMKSFTEGGRKQKDIPDYLSQGVYVDLPKHYTTARLNVDKDVASQEDKDMVSTADYLYDYLSRGGSLDDFPYEMAEGMHMPTVLLFRRKYQKKYGGREYK